MVRDDRLITLEEVRHTLSTRFGITYEVRMLRYVLKALDVRKLDEKPNQSTGKGRVAYYHPMVVWLVASAHLGRSKPSMTVATGLMATYRDFAMRALDPATPASVEQLAYWLAITGPDYGMRIADLRRLLTSDPSLLDLVEGDGDSKLMALDVYKEHVIDSAVAEERRDLVELIPYVRPTIEQERFRYADSVLRWLHRAGLADKPTLREEVMA